MKTGEGDGGSRDEDEEEEEEEAVSVRSLTVSGSIIYLIVSCPYQSVT